MGTASPAARFYFCEAADSGMDMRILLISNSTVYGGGYLDHVEQEIRSFLGGARRVLFFPFALYDQDAYAAQAKNRFTAMGCSMPSSTRIKKASFTVTSNRRTFWCRWTMASRRRR